MKQTSFKLAVGMASRGYDVCPDLMPFIFDLVAKYNAQFICCSCGFSAAGAQEAVFREAAKRDIDYLLIVDTDVIPPPGSFEKLLESKKHIVSTPVWHYHPASGTIHLNATKVLNQYTFKEGSGLKEIEATSFGCILISKEVLNAFTKRKESFTVWSPILEEKYKENLSSDTIFYKKAKKFGYPLFVNWEIKGAVHYTRVQLSTQVLAKFLDNIGVVKG